MVAPFTYVSYPSRVLFGPGTLGELGRELQRLGVGRALLLSTPQQAALARDVSRCLGGLAAGICDRAAMHTPIEVTDAAMLDLQTAEADGLVALGGGSTIGLGKALTARTGLPLVAVPITYAGSEMTTILGETAGGRKTTMRTPKVLPKTVIYDVELTLSLPAALSAASGVNALAHAVEALYAHDSNPIVALMAEAGVAALGRGLPAIVRDPGDKEARSDAQYGAWLCATCLGTVAMGLHHKVCHVLGGSFDLPHAETHAVMLPHVAAYNAAAATDAMRRIARALGARKAALGLYDLNRAIGAPAALRELGMPEGGLHAAAQQVTEGDYRNPRPAELEAARAMLARAWAGEVPWPD